MAKKKSFILFKQINNMNAHPYFLRRFNVRKIHNPVLTNEPDQSLNSEIDQLKKNLKKEKERKKKNEKKNENDCLNSYPSLFEQA